MYPRNRWTACCDSTAGASARSSAPSGVQTTIDSAGAKSGSSAVGLPLVARRRYFRSEYSTRSTSPGPERAPSGCVRKT